MLKALEWSKTAHRFSGMDQTFLSEVSKKSHCFSGMGNV